MGVIATRYSWFLTSLGTPTFTCSLLALYLPHPCGNAASLSPGPFRSCQTPSLRQQHGDHHGGVADPALEHRGDQVLVGHPERLHVGLLVLGHEVAAVRGAQVPRELEVHELVGEPG